MNYLSGGTTQQLIDGVKQDTDFGSTLVPRLTIGGIHFWGHTDFYVTFPLPFLTQQDKPDGLHQLDVYQGVETGMRIYLLSAWFFGMGPSAALQLSKSAYLRENYPYLYENYSAAILSDLTFGRYFNNMDANINLAYRTYGDRFEGFGTEIRTRRHSLGIEAVKFLFNYLGFVPFVGPILSYENLNTSVNGIDYTENKLALGVTFGWDIRVTKTGSSLLRTNLRYYPDLYMNVEGEKMMFDHLEFNFIQWVQFIGRKKAFRQ